MKVALFYEFSEYKKNQISDKIEQCLLIHTLTILFQITVKFVERMNMKKKCDTS